MARESLADAVRLPGHLARPLAILLEFLVCGEESATHAFGDSLIRSSPEDEHACLAAMARDEEVHAWLIHQWLDRLGHAPAEVDRMASRRFFMRLQTRDRALHFARIAGLDTSVCRLLSQLVQSAALAPYEGLVSGLARIRSDEARHVSVSRAFALRLGMSRADLSAVATDIEAQLLTLMRPAEPAMRLLTGSGLRIGRILHGEMATT